MKKIYIVLIVALLATACMGFKSRMKLANKSKMQMTQEDMSDLFVEVHSKVRLQTGTDEPDDLFSVEATISDTTVPQQWYDLAEFQKDCVPYNDWMTESCSEAGYATAEQDQLWKDYLSCSWWNGYTGFINFIPGGVDVMVADKQHSIQGSMCASNYLTFMQGYSLCNSYEFNAVFGYIAAIIHGHSENVTGEQFAKWSEVHVKRVSETFDGERDCPEVLKTIKHRLNFQAGIKKPYPLKLKEGESYQIS